MNLTSRLFDRLAYHGLLVLAEQVAARRGMTAHELAEIGARSEPARRALAKVLPLRAGWPIEAATELLELDGEIAPGLVPEATITKSRRRTIEPLLLRVEVAIPPPPKSERRNCADMAHPANESGPCGDLFEGWAE